MDKKIIGVKSLSIILELSEKGVRQRIFRGGVGLPPHMKLGGRVCWRLEDVEHWLEVQAKLSGAAVAAPVDLILEAQVGRRRPGRPRKNL